MQQSPDPRRDTILDEPAVWQEITRVARAALRDAPADDDQPLPVRTRVRSESADAQAWEVRAQPLLQGSHGLPVVVVAIERAVPAAERNPEVESIRERFGISPRQAEVAALLARRLTDKEIAARLGVSRHTARRHVELVMIRLRVHSRAEVGDLLNGTTDAPLPLAAVGES